MIFKFKPLPKGSNFSKGCGLCRGTGHNRTKCQQLFERFGKFSIPLSNISQRKKLAMNLNASEFNGSLLFHKSFEDERSVIKEFTNHVKCLVIHAIFFQSCLRFLTHLIIYYQRLKIKRR